jgi:tryptophan-rich hypothetical protein
MNPVNPKALLNSKWTKVSIKNKEKHFTVTLVEKDEEQNVVLCVIEAVINNHEYSIDWRELKNSSKWQQGWQ